MTISSHTTHSSSRRELKKGRAKEERGEGPDLRDNSRRILRHRLKDLPGAIFRLLDVEHGEDHRERHEDRCVRELLAWADTPTETER